MEFVTISTDYYYTTDNFRCIDRWPTSSSLATNARSNENVVLLLYYVSVKQSILK